MRDADQLSAKVLIEKKIVQDMMAQRLGINEKVDANPKPLPKGRRRQAMMGPKSPEGHHSFSPPFQGSGEEKLKLADLVAAVQIRALSIIFQPETI